MKKVVGFFLNLFSTVLSLIALLMVVLPVPFVFPGANIGWIEMNPLPLFFERWSVYSIKETFPVIFRLGIFFVAVLMFFLNVAFLVKSRQSGIRPLLTVGLALPSSTAYFIYIIIKRWRLHSMGIILGGKSGALFVLLVIFFCLVVTSLIALTVVLGIAYTITWIVEKIMKKKKAK